MLTSQTVPAEQLHDILRRIRSIAQERLSVTPEQIEAVTAGTPLVSGLQLDSLAQVTFVSAVEEEFGIELEMEDREAIATIQDLARIVALRMQTRTV
jgi:acyl carrier protein